MTFTDREVRKMSFWIVVGALYLGFLLFVTRDTKAAPPAQIEEIAHTSTVAVYRVQDGGCTVYLAQEVRGAGAYGPVSIALTPRCQ